MIDLDEVPELDLVLTGSVAVNLEGARLGKGGGFSDLEYGLLREAGRIDRHTVVATTLHPIQILREDLLMTAHDIPVDVVATPRAVVDVEGDYRAPEGSCGTTSSPPRSTRSLCWSASATRAEERGSSRSPAHQSRPVITPPSAATSSFQGWRIVAGRISASSARRC